jgi:hypothetical protein
MDADGEIYSLQNFGSLNGAKVCAQYRLPSFATNERDSQETILFTRAISEREPTPTPHLSPLPASGARRIMYPVLGLELLRRYR